MWSQLPLWLEEKTHSGADVGGVLRQAFRAVGAVYFSPKTWSDFYLVGLNAVRRCEPLATKRLDEITSEHIAAFAAYRQTQGSTRKSLLSAGPKTPLKTSSVNSSLRVLRRVMKVAVEWGVLPSTPKIKLLPGEEHRERVFTVEEEIRYLAAAPAQLASIAAVLTDTGMRPEELFRRAGTLWTERLVEMGHCLCPTEKPKRLAGCCPSHREYGEY